MNEIRMGRKGLLGNKGESIFGERRQHKLRAMSI
jgi:hypothetical protein